MLGRIVKLVIVTFATEFGGALIQAGRGWLDRRLNTAPTASEASSEAAAPSAPDEEG